MKYSFMDLLNVKLSLGGWALVVFLMGFVLAVNFNVRFTGLVLP